MAIAVPNKENGRPTSSATAAAAAPARPPQPAIPPVSFEHEQLAVRRGDRSGAYCIVAIHSTALGPALGGLRMWHYPATIDAARDALRLATGMTYKAAAAGLDLGGGKGVICAPADGLEGERRRAALLDFGDLVASLDGRYITAEDVGISPADLVAIGERTEHLTGLPPERGGSGDPSPFTAIGVEAAIRACLRARFGSAAPAGRRVAVIGLGHVGAALARRLAEAGCELLVTDIDARKHALVAGLGAQWIDPGEAMTAECDVLAPCALGGAISADNVFDLRCEIVCGSANNQLADEGLAAVLAERGILYAPDFIANAGGLIHVYMEIKGYSESRAIALAEGIETTVSDLLERADRSGTSPLEAARTVACERLDTALRD
jgi:leucine dehydrogenase